jgi:hypothetical protein
VVKLYLPGWPFVSQVSAVRGTPGGGIKYEYATTFYMPLAVDIAIGIALIALCYIGITRFAFRQRLRFSVGQLFALTTGVAFTTLYFTWNPDVFLWDLFVVVEDNRMPMHVSTLDRPLW